MKSKVRNKLQARVLAAAVCSLAISAAAQKPGQAAELRRPRASTSSRRGAHAVAGASRSGRGGGCFRRWLLG